MAALPYMQLYVADYLADTAHLTTLENGAYLLLIFNYWQRGESFKARDEHSLNRRLASVARTTSDEWGMIKESIAEFFETSEIEWRHVRIERDLHNVNTKSEKARNAGKASAASKASVRSTSVEQTFNHIDTDTDTDTDKSSKPFCTTGVVLAHPSLHNVCTSAFEQFWTAYPKRKNRGRAEKAWLKLKPDAGLIAEILQAVEVAKASDDWLRDGGKFIPYPETWLNANGWQDEVEIAQYGGAEMDVMDAYDTVLVEEKAWPDVAVTPYSPERAVAIRTFLTFSDKPDWVRKYFDWIGKNLDHRDGLGFDWVIRRDTFLRVKEGNFSGLRASA